MKEIITTRAAPAAIGPYSQAVKCGRLIFVSGQLPLDPATGRMPESAREQAVQCLNNVKAILEAAGAGMGQVLRVGVFMADLADFKAFNEVYATYFTTDYPARATVQVAALPLGARLEIEAVAEL